MTGSRSDNEVTLIPDTVKEAVFFCKLQRAMCDDGFDVREEEMEDGKTAFIFGVLRRPGPRPKSRQQPSDPQPDARTMADPIPVVPHDDAE